MAALGDVRECPTGHPVEVGQRFCPECGVPISRVVDQGTLGPEDASQPRRRLALVAATAVAVVVVVVGFVVLANRAPGKSKANFVQSEVAIQALNRCEQNLSEWTIFISNYPRSGADVSSTFGAESPIAIWLNSEHKSFEALVASTGQVNAQEVLGTQAVARCVSLRSTGTPIGAIPAPPQSPNDPPPAFKGRIPASS